MSTKPTNMFAKIDAVTLGTTLLAAITGVWAITSEENEREKSSQADVNIEVDQPKRMKKKKLSVKRVLGLGAIAVATVGTYQLSQGKSFADMVKDERSRKNTGKDLFEDALAAGLDFGFDF